MSAVHINQLWQLKSTGLRLRQLRNHLGTFKDLSTSTHLVGVCPDLENLKYVLSFEREASNDIKALRS